MSKTHANSLYLRLMNRRQRLIIAICGLLIIVIGGMVFATRQQAGDGSQGATSNNTSSQSDQSKLLSFDKKQYSLDDPASQWVIVNKQRPLQPIDYAPTVATPAVALRLSAATPEMQLSTQIIPAVEKLFADAKQDGLSLMLASGYRSYKDQVTVYGNEVSRNGQQAADRESARPGHSEHQTGLALDVEPASRQCEVTACFGDLPEGKWLALNAHKYGFIIRYSQPNESITGYAYEPWHIRYVGNELADEIQRQGNPPLETFFGLDAAPGYR